MNSSSSLADRAGLARPAAGIAASSAGTLPGRAATTALFLLGMALMFNPILWDGLGRSIGDSGDGLILLATLEHWFRLAEGHTITGVWNQIGSFYPTPDTLGMTDTYFLYAIPFSLLRALGVGTFAAYNVTIALLATIGYWSFYALTRRWAGAPAALAAIPAFIFAFGAMPMFKIGHAQTYSVMLAPALGLLLLAAWRDGPARPRLAAAAAAGLLYALMVFTAAQTPWFLGVVGGLVAVLWYAQARPALMPLLRPRLWPAAAFLAGFVIGFIPSALLYLRHASATPLRPFNDLKYYLPVPTDILQVPPGNLLWFGLLHQLGISDKPGRPLSELALGYTPFFVLTVAALVLLLGVAARTTARRDRWDATARACLGAAVICWLMQLNYWGTRPWWLVWRLVPGGAMIRTPFRIQLATLFFMCLALAHAATRMLEAGRVAAAGPAAGFNRRLGGPAGALMLLGGALALSVIEQFGPGAGMRRTAEVSSWLDHARPPPFPCQAFYVVPLSGSHLQWYEDQSDAMMLAQRIGIPTLNGNSSWWPPGWSLMDPAAPDYPKHVLDWIRLNHLQGRVCGVDPRAGRWVPGEQALRPATEKSPP
ncbi:MAG TPA: hypothetical protein VME92_20150 [Acetobacteraceae bacterium]|nr:hypothetical protein [Acetobacteraceae bacterium]